ncbi:MAG: adenylosuccinate lyase [Bacillota bacterium]|nr:MAG: adenylosuccinate lyase [Bacillota bacterium]
MIDRYTRPVMARLWSQANRYRRWLEIEVLACQAQAKLGRIPAGAAERITAAAAGIVIDEAFVAEVDEIESQVRHDVIAFVSAVAHRLGEDGRYAHFGLTSYDVVDTALSSLMVEAMDVIGAGLDSLLPVLADLAVRHRDTLMVARTHGVHAEPATFGLKMALWYAEGLRNVERLRRAREEIAVGRLAGAVGTYANVDPAVEAYVCEKLGLRPAPVSTQVLGRDRHAAYLGALAVLASSLDRYAIEIRSLQRTEIREVEEPFEEGQKGSSAMPHKRNPVGCEQVSGLARVVRAYAGAALENIGLWHERDISNSSVERVIIPDSTTLVDYMLHRFTGIMKGLSVYPKRMLRNLESTRGLVYSQRVLLALVDAGMSREAAYEIVQRHAMALWRRMDEAGGPADEEGRPIAGLDERLASDPEVTRYLDPEILVSCFDPRWYLRNTGVVFERLGLG